MKEDSGPLRDRFCYMLIVNLNKPESEQLIGVLQRKSRPVALEPVFTTENSLVPGQFRQVRRRGFRMWVNSLWTSLNAGHDND